MQSPPLEDHVRLVLFQREIQRESLYLDIPIPIIHNLCLKPCKYLRYLGWSVLGVEGTLVDSNLNEVNLDSDLLDQVYKYKLPSNHPDVLLRAVDLEVIKRRTHVPSETTNTREDFRGKLVERDGDRCVWSGHSRAVGMHIIPHRRDDEWLQLIIRNRSPGRREDRNLTSVNDIRNGVMAAASLHEHFDFRDIVILKTPNLILDMADVPARAERHPGLPPETQYPLGARYSLQWLITEDPFNIVAYPNNRDAAFRSHASMPSETLLHYNYGAAAVTHWGKNSAVLENRGGLPRPKKPGVMLLGPKKVARDRTTTVKKLEAARNAAGKGKAANRDGAGSPALTDPEASVWDEDDWMMFFMLNSEASRERHAEEQREFEQSINDWREGVVE